MLFGPKNVVALDIGTDSVKVVQLKSTPKGYRLMSLGMAQVPPDAIVDSTVVNTPAVIAAIHEASKNSKTKVKDVVTAISGHSVIVKNIKVPTMTEEELAESIVWEAEQYIPFSIDDVILDFQITSKIPDERTKQMDVLLVAAKKEKIASHVELIENAGLNPVLIDVDSFAIVNAFELNAEVKEGETVALIDMGAGITNINIIKGGVPQFTRDISLGGNHFTKAIQKEFNLSFEQAEKLKREQTEAPPEFDIALLLNSVTMDLQSEIQRSFDYYKATSGDRGVERIVLSGGSAKIKDIATFFSRRLGVPTEIANPLKNIQYNLKEFDPHYMNEIAPLLMVGIGLSLRKVGDR